jgi:hypothetical protein
MKTVNMIVPEAKELAQGTFIQFPDDFMVPYTVLIREAWLNYERDIKKAPTQFNYPGHGVLTMQGRKYRFEFDPKYAARKGYDSVREGVWG